MWEMTYVGVKVLERVSFYCVDTEFGPRLDSCEAPGHLGKGFQSAFMTKTGQATLWHDNIQKNCLLPPLSSMTSIKPGLSCSIEGTC